MTRRLGTLLVLTAAGALAAPPAALADAPFIERDLVIHQVVQNPAACGSYHSLIQTAYFDPETQALQRFVVTGLQARVGNELMDVGRVILLPLGGGRTDLVLAAGQHPVREVADLGTLRDALPAFCEVLA